MDRMSMAVRGVYTTESAKMTLATPGPRTAISAMASRMAGKAMSPSMTRITITSSRRS